MFASLNVDVTVSACRRWFFIATVAEKLVFFDVSAESISADVTRIDVPARTIKVALEDMTGQTSLTPTAFAIICT